MLYCARAQINDEIEKKIISLLNMDLDWEYLINTASYHRLLSILYVTLNFISPEKVPEDVLEYLKKKFQTNTLKNLRMAAELIKIMDLLYLSKINTFTYKGPALSILAYGNLSLRNFNDIDIFVNLKNVKKTIRILETNGYESSLPLMLEKKNICLKHHRAHVFNNGETNIDLQWELFYIHTNKHFNHFSKKDLIKINFNNYEFLTPNIEYQIIILSLHNASHLWNSLLLLCDLDRLISSNEIKWDKLISLADEIGMKRILLINFLLLENIMDHQVLNKINWVFTDKKAEKIALDIQNKLFNPKSNYNFLRRGFLQYQIRENRFQGLRDLMYLLFNPTEEDYQTISIPNFLYKLYSFVRLYNLIRKIYT